MPSVLILCTGNSARSQMAEGLSRKEGGAAWEVCSAGTRPTKVRPEAIAAMREIGIDISRQWSKSVEGFAGREFDYVITVCDHANAICPVFPGKTHRFHWPSEDPAGIDDFRRVRDEIHAKVKVFVANRIDL